MDTQLNSNGRGSVPQVRTRHFGANGGNAAMESAMLRRRDVENSYFRFDRSYRTLPSSPYSLYDDA
jgi:hypothetical protein